jgi:hypothetical protein
VIRCNDRNARRRPGVRSLLGSAEVYTLDLNRFAKLCDQLNSSHPTERAVASAKASAMLAAADLTWSDIIFGGTGEPEPRMADIYGVHTDATCNPCARRPGFGAGSSSNFIFTPHGSHPKKVFRNRRKATPNRQANTRSGRVRHARKHAIMHSKRRENVDERNEQSAQKQAN